MVALKDGPVPSRKTGKTADRVSGWEGRGECRVWRPHDIKRGDGTQRTNTWPMRWQALVKVDSVGVVG